LKSAREVRGYHILSTDRQFGHIEDFIIDDAEWAMRYVVADTRNWWPSPCVLLSSKWINEVRWDTKQIVTHLPYAKISRSPTYDNSEPVTRSFEIRLHEFYDQKPYWVPEEDSGARKAALLK
jgi:hypothetical protein